MSIGIGVLYLREWVYSRYEYRCMYRHICICACMYRLGIGICTYVNMYEYMYVYMYMYCIRTSLRRHTHLRIYVFCICICMYCIWPGTGAGTGTGARTGTVFRSNDGTGTVYKIFRFRNPALKIQFPPLGGRGWILEYRLRPLGRICEKGGK